MKPKDLDEESHKERKKFPLEELSLEFKYVILLKIQIAGRYLFLGASIKRSK